MDDSHTCSTLDTAVIMVLHCDGGGGKQKIAPSPHSKCKKLKNVIYILYSLKGECGKGTFVL